MELTTKQIISKAVISDRIIDIFEAAGIQKPELSILSEGFLSEVKETPHLIKELQRIQRKLRSNRFPKTRSRTRNAIIKWFQNIL